MKGLLKTLGGLVVATLAGLVGWLALFPPELLKVGDGYAAKIVCSNVFLAGRDPQEVLEEDVQAPGHPLLKLVRVSVDREEQSVTARLLGFAAPGRAVYRPGRGCANVSGGSAEAIAGMRGTESATVPLALDPSLDWPDGDKPDIDPAIQKLVEDPALAGPGMRAIVVVRDGRLVAETYAAGFDRNTPLLGWSMTKSVTAAIIGRRIAEGRMDLAQTNLVTEWNGDDRARIKLTDLLAMQSGLDFNEDYGDVTDVTRMLYLESDMAGFVASKPLEAAPGTNFAYSSGTSNLLSRLWMQTFDDPAEALSYPREALFAPLGMTSAVMETDASGTFVGSSYMYASAQDWARFAEFLLQDGSWKGRRLLPEGYVSFMRTPTAASGGDYGAGQVWLQENGTRAGTANFPPDTFWMLGHDGQAIMIVPSLRLAVVRLGLTPSRLGYDVQKLNSRIIDALD
ncbi:serine hydrolase [Sinorhizobium meliloti]|uniref:serine hydrolase domain-containing protein n=1 Tax=Rhizobium meliloti TaxID=382 RepID=UPI00040F5DAF|nr:serine hydrolase [Sinorhizobium meliloti]MDW9358357.1 serine hydrolase [Sinorhizobium meliloti]MDW9657702.1 serine hydrolase [Sinorhizobium meliloti]MDW9917696.1 serine hydrolase [Sinorhizobium meliloti]MDW9942484.1 serine hydrolase [Sinorhizobium meliloti]MDW9948849.1 serine hydrolase [Sinorhizobium meliloti]